MSLNDEQLLRDRIMEGLPTIRPVRVSARIQTALETGFFDSIANQDRLVLLALRYISQPGFYAVEEVLIEFAVLMFMNGFQPSARRR